MIWDAAEYLKASVVYGGIGLLILIYFVVERGILSTLEKHTIEKWRMIES